MKTFINLSLFTLLIISLSLSLDNYSIVIFAAAATAPNIVVPPETICNSTVDPPFCKTVLANQNGTVFDYARISVRKSLSESRKFLSFVDSNLRNTSSLSQSTVAALQDCQFLALQNFEYLFNIRKTVDTSNTTTGDDVLPTSQAEETQTFLSAVLTNQQTCLDGLSITPSDQAVKDAFSIFLNNTKLHSVSLALFVKGWVPDDTKKTSTSFPQNGRHLNFGSGHLPLNMTNQVRAVYDSAIGHGRKLLQTLDESVTVNDIVVVSQDGTGNFTTINDAIAVAPNNTLAGNGYFLIFITEGVYQEYISIAKNKKYLMMVGDGINRTIITGDHNVVDGFTTFNSPTFAVVAQGFLAVNITFRNTAGPSKHQAVAVRNGADLSTFYSCSFEGYQDTLYTHSLRQFYRECDIYGTVDFIFGNAAVVLQNCNIYPRLPSSGQFNAITAQGRTDPNQNTGISIHNATIKAADDLASMIGTVKTYLGRPWKEYSRTIYMQCLMESLINPSGWREWSGDFALSTLYYAEFNNTGAGSDTTLRVTWPGYQVMFNHTDAAIFTVPNFISGDNWLPQTGVPYFTGLV